MFVHMESALASATVMKLNIKCKETLLYKTLNTISFKLMFRALYQT